MSKDIKMPKVDKHDAPKWGVLKDEKTKMYREYPEVKTPKEGEIRNELPKTHTKKTRLAYMDKSPRYTRCPMNNLGELWRNRSKD